jgi:hypothetical protein
MARLPWRMPSGSTRQALASAVGSIARWYRGSRGRGKGWRRHRTGLESLGGAQVLHGFDVISPQSL